MKTCLAELSTMASSLLFATLLASTCCNPVFGSLTDGFEYVSLGGRCISLKRGSANACNDNDDTLIKARLGVCIDRVLSEYETIADGVLQGGPMPEAVVARHGSRRNLQEEEDLLRFRELMSDNTNNATISAVEAEEKAHRSLTSCRKTRCYIKCKKGNRRSNKYCVTSCRVKGVRGCRRRLLGEGGEEEYEEETLLEQEQGDRLLNDAENTVDDDALVLDPDNTNRPHVRILFWKGFSRLVGDCVRADEEMNAQLSGECQEATHWFLCRCSGYFWGYEPESQA